MAAAPKHFPPKFKAPGKKAAGVARSAGPGTPGTNKPTPAQLKFFGRKAK